MGRPRAVVMSGLAAATLGALAALGTGACLTLELRSGGELDAGCAAADACSAADAASEGGASPFAAPTVLASGEGNAQGIATGTNDVVWTTLAGEVRAVPKAGGGVRSIVSGRHKPTDVFVSGSDVIWLETVASCGSVVFSAPLAGGQPRTGYGACSAQGIRMSHDLTNLYLTVNLSGSELSVVRDTLGFGLPSVLLGHEGAGLGAVGTGGSWVFWAVRSVGTIKRLSVTDSDAGAEVFASGLAATEDLAGDGTSLYWANGTSLTKLAFDKPNQTPDVLVAAQGTPTRIALDDGHVYWTDSSLGSVRRVAKTGGTPETIATNQGAPFAIAVDTGGVYWTNAGSGEVVMAARR